DAYANIYQRNQKLFDSIRQQREVGVVSQQSLLTQQLTLLLARQNLQDTRALLIQSSVTLIKNLGGGWQWDDSREAAVASTAAQQHPGAGPGVGAKAQ